MGTVAGRSTPSNGNFSVADPRFTAGGEYGQLGVRRWEEPTGTVTGQRSPIQGAFSVADPRHLGVAKHSNEFRIVPWDKHAQTVTGAHGTGQCVADPRSTTGFGGKGKYIVTPFDAPCNTVIAGSTTGQGAFAVADPRSGLDRAKGDHYLTGGHYGVTKWNDPSGAVSASANLDNGRWSVADPRIDGITQGVNAALPAAADKLVSIIRALDGTWHRPFTTLELAAIQSLVEPEEYLQLDGLSDSDWRERIGNAVPPDAAEAIANVMGTTLLLAWSGETFVLSATPIWVRPIAIALSIPTEYVANN
jgi:site-specific DNA-cytosine methylase